MPRPLTCKASPSFPKARYRSASSSDDKEGEFSGYTREEIFFPEETNSPEFCENRGVRTASSGNSDNSALDPGLKGSWKRKKIPIDGKRNVRKRARTKGTRYRLTSKRIKSPRKKGPPCSCPKKCKEEQEHLIMQFNHMGSHELQNKCLRGFIVASNVKRCGELEGNWGQQVREKINLL